MNKPDITTPDFQTEKVSAELIQLIITNFTRLGEEMEKKAATGKKIDALLLNFNFISTSLQILVSNLQSYGIPAKKLTAAKEIVGEVSMLITEISAALGQKCDSILKKCNENPLLQQIQKSAETIKTDPREHPWIKIINLIFHPSNTNNTATLESFSESLVTQSVTIRSISIPASSESQNVVHDITEGQVELLLKIKELQSELKRICEDLPRNDKSDIEGEFEAIKSRINHSLETSKGLFKELSGNILTLGNSFDSFSRALLAILKLVRIKKQNDSNPLQTA